MLLFSAAALTTYTFTPTTVAEGNHNTMSLGSLTSGDVITVLVEFPNPAAGTSPTQYYPLALYNNLSELNPQPSGFGSSNATAINFSGSDTFTWTISATGAYYLRILAKTPADAFIPYKATVSNSNGGEIVKISDALRLYFMALIELASTQATYTISIASPGAIGFNSMDANYTFTRLTPTNANASGNTYSNLTAGSYVLQNSFMVAGSIIFQTDTFPCPSSYDPNFINNPQLYQACTPTTTTTSSDTSEDNSTRNRNIALITVFSFVAVAGLIILFVVLAKKGAAAGTTVTSTAAANETSHINIQNANSSNQNTAQVNYESSLKHL